MTASDAANGGAAHVINRRPVHLPFCKLCTVFNAADWGLHLQITFAATYRLGTLPGGPCKARRTISINERIHVSASGDTDKKTPGSPGVSFSGSARRLAGRLRAFRREPVHRSGRQTAARRSRRSIRRQTVPHGA